jgi:hypothetical protein
LEQIAENLMMKITSALLAAAMLAVPVAASAQDTTIIHRETTTVPEADVDVRVRTETTETTGAVVEPCQTKTVKKEDGMGNSVTKSKTNC